jgi:WD40 repeat protein
LGLAWAPDDSYIVCSGSGGSLLLWKARDIVKKFGFQGVSYDPCARYGGDLNSKTPQGKIEPHRDSVVCAQFSNHSKFLRSLIATTLLISIKTHFTGLQFLSVSKDNRILMWPYPSSPNAGATSVCYLWPIMEFTGHSDEVRV